MRIKVFTGRNWERIEEEVNGFIKGKKIILADLFDHAADGIGGWAM